MSIAQKCNLVMSSVVDWILSSWMTYPGRGGSSMAAEPGKPVDMSEL